VEFSIGVNESYKGHREKRTSLISRHSTDSTTSTITHDECTKPQFIGLLTAILYIKKIYKYQTKADITQLDQVVNVLLSNITFFSDICCFFVTWFSLTDYLLLLHLRWFLLYVCL